MKKITLDFADLKKLSQAEFHNFTGKEVFENVTTDTRTMKAGGIFVAIAGDNFDGHEYIKEAKKKGAAAVVLQKGKVKQIPSQVPTIVVPDSIKGLGELAAVWRKKLSAKVIALTGSNGKTTTKEMLLAVLGEKYSVNGTVSNNNNFIGVPLTIFSTNASHEYVVIEMGTNHIGEIAYLAGIVQPDYALVTNIGPSHLEFLGTIQGVKKEKVALLKVTNNRKGKVFINTDDKLLKPYAKEFDDVVTYGSHANADVCGKVKRFNKFGYPVLSIDNEEKNMDVTVPIYGKTNALNVLAATAIGLECGLTKQDIISGIKKLHAPKQRLEEKELKNSLILDDTYNANPQSMIAAFDVVKNIKYYKNRWVILGDMRELGEESAKLHKMLAAPLMKIDNVRVFTIGEHMYNLFKELKKYYVPVWHFTDRKALIENINDTDFSHSVILVKGSRGMKMEEFVKVIKEKYE
jgi:UDP-N-acetylmuramoyl-tripeptide--D-alanyl-D-alanine ligase